jgi:Family of unknown function (DUF6893)
LFGKRTLELTAKTQIIHGWPPTKAPLWRAGPEDGAGGTDMTRLLFVAAAAVGLVAVLARSVVPDVTRYLRIRRM